MVTPPWVKGSEIALIERLRRDEGGAWPAFIKDHESAIYSYCRRMLRSEEKAKDVCQEVFARAARAIGRFRGDASLRTWLHRIAVNRCRSQPRNRDVAVDDRCIADLPDEGLTPEAAIINRELGAAIGRALGQLDVRFREAVILSLQGYSYIDIASMTGVGIDTVKSRIHRGRERLRLLLAEFRP